MSEYERRAWMELEAYWTRKAEGRLRVLPEGVRSRTKSAGRAAQTAASSAGQKIGQHTPKRVKDASGVVLDTALFPVAKAAAHLLELTTDWTQELMDPQVVLRHHLAKGRDVGTIAELQDYDLKVCDEVTRSMVLRWRTSGAFEGAAMGGLAMVPIAGAPIAISADMVVVHILSTAIATRVAYAYGYDARDSAERALIDRLVLRAFGEQAPKSATMRSSASAFQAGLGRVRWSEKLRNDHKLMAALEKLMGQFTKTGRVPVKSVTKAVPFVSIVAGAGGSAYVLGDVAKQAQYYCRTAFLSHKYELPLPAGMTSWRIDPGQDDGTDST